ncbi:hypothetical protein LVD13_01905 [Flavobacteriaceae bacterium D16]|nr:hypothetical protein [Flavobacteriaceae bacterium D16]
MKNILVSVITLMTFWSLYGQEIQPKNERLTASFEKKWSAPLVATRFNIQEVTEVRPNTYQNPIDSYAKVFLDTSVKRKKGKNLPLRPPYATAFIFAYKPK